MTFVAIAGFRRWLEELSEAGGSVEMPFQGFKPPMKLLPWFGPDYREQDVNHFRLTVKPVPDCPNQWTVTEFHVCFS